jgi:hypothetical protein
MRVKIVESEDGGDGGSVRRYNERIDESTHSVGWCCRVIDSSIFYKREKLGDRRSARKERRKLQGYDLENVDASMANEKWEQ